MSVFDYTQRARAKTRIDTRTEHAPYPEWTAHMWQNVADRLCDIKGAFKNILIIGPLPPDDITHLLVQEKKWDPANINSAAFDPQDRLNIIPGAYDLIICIATLHAVNDLPTVLLQLRLGLAENGCMIAALPGEDSLTELRQALTQAELSLRGGASPRLHPTIDARSLAGLMQQAQFALPVVDLDRTVIEYQNLNPLLQDLRAVGESNALLHRPRHFAPRALFTATEKNYRAEFATPDNRLPATLTTLYAIGWAG